MHSLSGVLTAVRLSETTPWTFIRPPAFIAGTDAGALGTAIARRQRVWLIRDITGEPPVPRW